MEQVNIEGKRSGDGFVAHKDTLVSALARVLAERISLFDGDSTIGRKGFLGYLKALAGSNVVKIVPANGSASGLRATEKGLKVVCGSHESYIPDGAWIKDKMPFTFSQIRVSPSNAIVPNLGSVELAEALARVLPFTASDDSRPILGCVKVVIKEGKLTLVSADGFRLAIASLNFDGSEAEALINRDDMRGLIPALRKAKRARLAVEQESDSGDDSLTRAVIVDTELVRYKLHHQDGSYPDYEKVIPAEFTAKASFDTKEAIKASRSLLTIWHDDKIKPDWHTLILSIANGKIGIEATEERGKAEIEAETEGEGKIAVNGKYLLDALKACDGIVSLQVVSPTSPMLFSSNGYQLVVMPINAPEETKAQQPEAQAEAEAQAKPEAESKPKRKSRRKAKVKAEVEVESEAEPELEPEAELEPTDDELAQIEAEAVAV